MTHCHSVNAVIDVIESLSSYMDWDDLLLSISPEDKAGWRLLTSGRRVAEEPAVDPWKQVAAGILLRAIRDYRKGRDSLMVSDACLFLTGPYCEALFGYLGIDAQAAREQLGLSSGSCDDTNPRLKGQG